MKINQVLVRPVLTEKATGLVRKQVYTFEVNKKSNKHQVKEALKKLYDVEVEKVRIVMRKGKEKRVGRLMKSKMTPGLKIAYVTLSRGKIDLFPQA